MMEYNLYELKEKIDDYFCGHSSRHDLGAWGQEAYYDLLCGGYIQQKKLVLYPFLKTISQFHLEADDMCDIFPSEEKDVKQIQMVLQGKEDFSFQVTLSVPHRFQILSNRNQLDIFCKAQNLLEKFIDTSALDTDFQKYVKQILQFSVSDVSILDILQNQIMKFCDTLFEADDVRLKTPLRLYADKTASKVSLIKLKNMMECYMGNRNFIVVVSFNNGKPTLELFV